MCDGTKRLGLHCRFLSNAVSDALLPLELWVTQSCHDLFVPRTGSSDVVLPIRLNSADVVEFYSMT